MGILQMKLRARLALKGHWQTALLIALIVNLPSLLIQGISASTGNDLASRISSLLMTQLQDSGLSGSAVLTEQLDTASLGMGIWIMQGISLLVWLILTPFLELGMNHWVLDRLRKAEEPVSTVFSRVRIFFKSIGLRLAVSLRILLWALPGLAVCVLAIVLLLTAAVPAAEQSLSALPTATPTATPAAETALSFFRMESSQTYDFFPVASFFLLLLYMGLAGMIVLGFMSWLRFCQAEFILADEPDESVSSCLSRSRQMMVRRKGSYIGLLMSFVPLYLFIVFGSSLPSMLFGGNFGSILSLLLQMLGTLAISVSVLTARGAFYENLRAARAKAPLEDVEGSVGEPEGDPQAGDPAEEPAGDASDSASNDSSDAN